MQKRIVYQGDEGELCILIPTSEAMLAYGVDAIARKDVPYGRPYKIIDASDIPSDRSDRDAWFVDADGLTDGRGGASYEFD